MHAQFSNSLDVLLEVRAEQLSIHELAALRAVCAQLKQQVCEAVRSLHAAELAKILQCTTTFPAVEEVRLVEIDFTEWAAHCAERLAHRVATHILWLRNEPNHRFVDRANALTCWQTLLVSRLLGVQPLELGLSDVATVEAMDRNQLILRLEDMFHSGQDMVSDSRLQPESWRRSPAGMLQWDSVDAILPDGRRGIFHASLDSVVGWRASQGRTIDRGAAFLYLRWFTRTFGIGTHPKACVHHALRAHAEIRALRGLLRDATRTESADGLLRLLRQQFGAERTASMQISLRNVISGARSPGDDFPLPGVVPALATSFEEMVREVATHDLEHDKRGILRRKWRAVLSGLHAFRHGFSRVQQLVDELTADQP
ncbi:hypothetical protein EMIHUDRAFT_237527 [Emiliania huxleyi CCMP1516]|uniref:F-box domain-containing protein n=2 Tax=Emiliania huxleyi TaxID=2903 RepID=A0A0D3JPV0_EMIH1|nr:hypothetical protein EMIHUDRAFT_237527 [Emiliania huxleyi CCMP1516]EOD25535.1 hypothetical protein EMIHUDRAFT_237527 [Emiliania huxleyi CCMP1516]|eukprot:XP_005777964.1 hypothetical protein EMIHUDRAFT_237527 [Emiliania huxleyi CCMP1516]